MRKVSGKSRILAIVLSGGGRASVVGGAVRSASFVNGVLFIRTDDSSDDAISAGVEACEELGITTHVSRYDGDLDCATMRNFGLAEAAKLPYVWGMTLDTDERMVYSDREFIGELDKTSASVLLVRATRNSGYSKERFFRLPAVGRFMHRVHEAYSSSEKPSVLQGVLFDELPKTAEQTDATQRFVERICLEEIAAGNSLARHYMYLGESRMHFRRVGDARDAFQLSVQHAQSDEQKCWSLFRAAQMSIELDDYDLAIKLCFDGMLVCPAWPEFPWLISASYTRTGDIMHAITWARITCALGHVESSERMMRVEPERVFLRAPTAAWEGGWDILAKCYAALASCGGASSAMLNKESEKAARVAASAKAQRAVG